MIFFTKIKSSLGHLWLIHTARDRDRGGDREKMEFYITLCTVHYTVVFYCAHPGPVQCVWAISRQNKITELDAAQHNVINHSCLQFQYFWTITVKFKICYQQEEDFGIKPEMFVSLAGRPSRLKGLSPEQVAIKRRKIWVSIIRKEIPKAHKQKVSNRKEVLGSLKKVWFPF